MILLPDRQKTIKLIGEACLEGARKEKACKILGVSIRTLQRWHRNGTCKYRPSFPYKGFCSIQNTRDWVLSFVKWYNFIHRHSSIKFVTPHQRHSGEDVGILEARANLYKEARRQKPERWSSKIRNWSKITAVSLNPEKDLNLTSTSNYKKKVA